MIASILIIVFIIGNLSLPAMILDPYKGVWSEIGRGEFSGSQTFSIKGLNNEVTVVLDERMIPHIYAQNDEDAFFAVGFLHGVHRLWQIDMQRRLAQGRLSEILGNQTLKQDIYMRIVGLGRAAKNTVEWLKSEHPEVYKLLESYSRGINMAIEYQKLQGKLPLMFKLLGYEPEPWKPEDSISWAKYMAWSLTNFWNPLVLTYLAMRLGYEDVNELYPVHPYYHDNVTTIPGDGSINGLKINVDPYELRSLNWFEEWATGVNLKNPGIVKGLEEAILSILELAGELPPKLGSNNWAVGPSNTISGKAIMADDPHLSLNIPSVWYEVHMKTPDMNVHGVTLPGIPFIIIGANENIAWGLTNTQIGVMDFYVEKINPEDPSLYWYEGSWRKVERIKEVIKVRGAKDYVLYVNITVHGPIISLKGLPISFKWTGNAGYKNDGKGVTREVLAIYLLNKAKGYEDLVKALQYWDVPSQNFAFADSDGNFGVVIPGLFPFRIVKLPDGRTVKVVSSRSVLNGTGDYEWEGYIPYEYVPKSINPKRGFIAAPNQMSVGPYYPYFILGAWWDPVARAQRIHILLLSKNKHSIEDMMSYQADITDWYAYHLVHILINAVKDKTLTPLESEAIELLKNWDYKMSKESVAATLWWAWFSALYDEMFKDIYESHGINRRFYPYPETVLWLAVNRPTSKWFKGDISEVAYNALKRAIQTLKDKLGEEVNKWAWGEIHKLLIAHLSDLRPLSYGPVPEDGGANILMNAPIPYDLSILERGYYVRHGPSWRIIAEMGDGNKIFGVYPGGQSGNPVSKHYTEFIELWLNYKYYEVGLPDNPQSVRSISEIRFVPG